MPGFATYQAIKDVIPGQIIVLPVMKAGISSEGAHVWQSSWRVAGVPAAGAVPATGAGTVPDTDTAGAIILPRLMSNASNSVIRHLLRMGSFCITNRIGVLLLDILWFNSGLDGTVTTAQTINSTALSRYTGGSGNMLALICWTATGTTVSNVIVDYTDQADAAQVTPSVALWTEGWGGGALAPIANQIQILPLNGVGIKSVQSLTLSASTLTAGDFGAMIFRIIAYLPVAKFADYAEIDFVLQMAGLMEDISKDACLCFWAMLDTTGGNIGVQGPLVGIWN